ncbi:ABC-ATPase domain-containing protein [Collinsella tanakaei]|nr:ABC-ATPase domain-containing protein [Collinsella tanakaei]
MKTDRDLARQLASIERRGYPAYKSLRGSYDMGGFTLSIDHVQGDPFAAPSQLSVVVPARTAGFPRSLFDTPHRKVALEDVLIRRFAQAASRVSFKVGGSGKSGLLATSRPGPEVLARSACEVSRDGSITLRFEAGLPAHGRTVDARACERMLLDLVPRCVDEALVCDDRALAVAQRAVDLADDQQAVRDELGRLGLVAFVADGSVLPRATGVSAKPLKGARPFAAPASMRVSIDLPHRGPTSGMGIARGITLIVGGGYHGKSTLPRALQDGVYNHVAGDGRELVITDATAVKLRAEDGRPVRDADISLFIGDLPDGRDTHRFSTEDASGSTSQAAGVIEALEAGARALLVDEDTSATNFMVRDALMEAVVSGEHEPITPFVERVRDLWEQAGVSCVIVAGSSGAFFSVADAVIQMDRYEAHDITERVRRVCADLQAPQTPRAAGFALPQRERRVRIFGIKPQVRGGRRGSDARIKVRVRGLDEFSVGGGSVDVRLVEQLVDEEQTSALAQCVRCAAARGLLDGAHTAGDIVAALYAMIDERGWSAWSEHGDASCGLALPRPHELFAALNRWRAAG